MNAPAALPTDRSFAVAGGLLDALAARDFDALASAFADGASFNALLPRGYREWTGAEEIRAAFEGWFGAAVELELTDAAVSCVGPLLQLRWLLRVRRDPTSDATEVIEQCAYAATGSDGTIQRLSLLCSGFHPEPR